MIELSQSHYYAPLLVMLVVFIISWIFLKKASIPGENWVHVILSLLISLVFVSSTSLTKYAINALPVITLITTLSFFIMLVTIFFVGKDFDPFKKILAWLGFVLTILIILCIAFQQFPVMNHMLPHSSDAGLNSSLEEFKDFIYTSDFRDNLVFVVSIVVVGFFLLATKAKK